MLRFEGDRDFALPLAVVFEKLGDARFLTTCIPGVETVSHVDVDRATCVLRPGFSFARGTLDLVLTIAERVAPASLRIQLQSKGIGSSSEVETSLALYPTQTGTRLNWVAEIKSLGGLLKAVPQGLIQASAQKVIGDALTAIEAKMGKAEERRSR
jgi:carbon monoxide dehydrogenase subunit G